MIKCVFCALKEKYYVHFLGSEFDSFFFFISFFLRLFKFDFCNFLLHAQEHI